MAVCPFYSPLYIPLILLSITARQIRNITSARVSVPSLVVPTSEPRPRGTHAFTWRTPLRTTGPYWEGVLLCLRITREIDNHGHVKVGSEDCRQHSLPRALRVSWCWRGLTASTASL
jgi:hypothetical protein